MKDYRHILIEGILRIACIRYSREELERKNIKELETIFSFYEKHKAI